MDRPVCVCVCVCGDILFVGGQQNRIPQQGGMCDKGERASGFSCTRIRTGGGIHVLCAVRVYVESTIYLSITPTCIGQLCGVPLCCIGVVSILCVWLYSSLATT